MRCRRRGCDLRRHPPPRRDPVCGQARARRPARPLRARGRAPGSRVATPSGDAWADRGCGKAREEAQRKAERTRSFAVTDKIEDHAECLKAVVMLASLIEQFD